LPFASSHRVDPGFPARDSDTTSRLQRHRTGLLVRYVTTVAMLLNVRYVML